MASISKVLKAKLEAEFSKQPLQEGEFRRIEGMGSHFASLAPTHEDKKYFFATKIGNRKIFIYKHTVVT